MNERAERFVYLRNLRGHLRELSVLVGRPVGKDELLTIPETRAIRARSKHVVRPAPTVFEIPFEERGGNRFASFMARLAAANPSNVYLWTGTTIDCGLLQGFPLMEFRVTFPFELSPNGIYSIVTTDLLDRLVLDYENRDGQQWIEVEVSGEHWGEVVY